MITVTVILNNHPQPYTLGYKTQAAVDAAMELWRESFIIRDDYGQEFTFSPTDACGLLQADVEKANNLQVDLSIERMRAEYRMKNQVQADPTLKFLNGIQGAGFMPPRQ